MSIAEIMESMEYGPAPEARDAAIEWIHSHDARFDLFIGGRWHSPQDGEYFDVINPASKAKLATVAQAGPVDIDLVALAAREAAERWRKTPGHVRARSLYAIARQIQRHSRLLAVLESLDNGKPIRESRDIDIPLVARHFYYHAGWAQLLDEEFTGYQPIGVVGQIIPWNFPLLMLAWKVAPALAAGNTVILKPAEFTPLTALAFAEIVERSGVPAGVVNVVTGDGRSGELLVQHPGVDKIAFTGSTEVGRAIRRATAGTGKRLSLELGGKSPFLVFDDADLDSVVEGVVDAIWFNQGQVCCAGSRLLVQESIESRLVSKLRARMERLRVGDPLDKAVDIGAIVAPVQLQRIEQLVATGVKEGATLWQPSWACPTDGYFYPPSLFTNVSPAATIAQVEIFGPVLVSMTFRTHTEAVSLANNTRYGLAASVWSENINLALDIAGQIKAGTVWINSSNVFDASSGFGGYRESGFGREGGMEGMFEYVKRVPRRLSGGRQTQDRPSAAPSESAFSVQENRPSIDRTPKMYIGGKQVRPDSGYSRLIRGSSGEILGEVGDGNRKDIRNAVEAARKTTGWGALSAHQRAQVIYYIAENLAARGREFALRLSSGGTIGEDAATTEVEATIERLFTYAAWSDKFDGAVHHALARTLTLAIPEPIGVIGIACPEQFPLLSFVSLVAPAICMGNTVVAIPSERQPLVVTDFYQVLETSDLPAGVINIVTGERGALARVLAEHDDVDAIWYCGDAPGCKQVEFASAYNMKRTWTWLETDLDWPDRYWQGAEFLREATQIKNIWAPYGV